MAQGSLLDFPAELITLIKQRPNSSRIMRSAAAFDLPIFSACSACARRHSHVASATSLVTNVKGSLKKTKTQQKSTQSQQKHTIHLTPGLGNFLVRGLMRFHLSCGFQVPLDNQQGTNKPQLQSSELVGHCALVPASIHVHLEIDSEIPRYIEQFSSFYSKGSSRITSSQ